VNYFGYVRTIRAVLPHMRARGSGIIHNVSFGVSLVGHPGLSGYTSTKGAIEALTRSLQLELRHENVSCTIVYPLLTGTQSAMEIDYPESLLNDPAEVGRKLAGKIESTGPTIAADWQTKSGWRSPSDSRTSSRRGPNGSSRWRDRWLGGEARSNCRVLPFTLVCRTRR
jgi:NAD(P)-dependent dehydrogenase (short-subunit alcohol dehydrogenase family)